MPIPAGPVGQLPFAVTADVARLWRPLTNAENALADALLIFASNMVRARIPTVDERIADARVSRALVRDVVASMVKRVLINPEGWKSQTVGPFTGQADPNAAAGYLYLTDAEAALLQPKPIQTGRSRRGSAQLAAALAPPGGEDYYRRPW
jgi:hypothetical protein